MRSVFFLLAAFVSMVAACSLTVDLPAPTANVGGGGDGGAGGEAESECTGPGDCPVPDNPCELAFCAVGVCGTVAVAPDERARVPEGSDGPCQTTRCDGLGGTKLVNDDEDIEDDGDPCTEDTCLQGNAVHAPKEIGATCSTSELEVGKCDAQAACVECLSADDCVDLEPSNECQTRRCVNGACQLDRKPPGAVLTTQNNGDCKRRECDGMGVVMEVNDDGDLPDDGNECTIDTCAQGLANYSDATDGDVCTAGVCSAGSCVGCNTAADCGTPPNACVSFVCNVDVCDVVYAPVGTEVDISATDCLTITCGPNGQLMNDPDNNETPATDNNQCTTDTCLGGVPTYPNKAQNATCTSMGGAFCDGGGNCVECNSGTQCSNPIGGCEVRTCQMNQCGVGNAMAGELSTVQIDDDCLVEVCDGMGTAVSQAQDTDLPFDGNQCTNDFCSGGMASNPPASAGTACNQGGNVCDGAGTCIACLVDVDCGQGYCENMQCFNRRNTGQSCNRDAMCSSGHCVDGVCCDGACNGTCQACVQNKTGVSTGKCANIEPNTDPDNECTKAEVCFKGRCCPPVSAGQQQQQACPVEL